MPTWRQGMAVGEWQQVSGSALSSAPMAVATVGNTGPQSKVIAWSGFAIDTRDSSIYSTANGGHTDYAGNEVNRIRLSDNAPAWTEPRASTPSSQATASSTHYADGRPASRHTCYGTVVNEVRGRAMTLGGSRWGNGSLLRNVDGFNLASNDWDAARTYSDFPADFLECAGIVEQKSTGNVFAFTQYNVMRWSNASNNWSQVLSGTPIYGQYAATAMDTRRNRVLVVGGNGGDHALYDVAANSAQSVTLTGANAVSVSGDGNGMVYDPYLDAFLVRRADAGGTIYRINAQTFAVDTLSSTGGSQLPSATNGVWRRFLYVPALKGVVYFPTYGDNLWFVRTY